MNPEPVSDRRESPVRGAASILCPLAVLLLVAVPCLNAQTRQFDFTHLTVRDGLSDAFVWPVLQDRDGYMWFGTTAGLDRFDGYTVERFMHDPQDTNSIRQGGVHALLEDADGMLWIGSNGLSRRDPASGEIIRIDLDPQVPADSQWTLHTRGLHQGTDGTIWAGTLIGLFAVTEENGAYRAERFWHDPADTSGDFTSQINAITGDDNDVLWIGTSGAGLFRIDTRSGAIRNFRAHPGVSDSLRVNWTWELYLDSSDQLWIGGRGGLCRLESVASRFRCYSHDPNDPNGLSGETVQSIWEDDDGRLWLGTDPGGVSIFDPANETFVHIRHDPTNPASLGEDDVHKVYQDRFGTLWFAHHSRGVSRMTPERVQFVTDRADIEAPASDPHNLVTDVLPDEDGTLWLATAHGLVHVDPASGASERFVPFPEDAPQAGVPNNRNLLAGLVEDSDGRLWIGMPSGRLMFFNKRDRTFLQIEDVETQMWIFPAFRDSRGHIWVGSDGPRGGDGLRRIDPATQTITRYEAHPDNPDSLAGNIAMPFLEFDGAIWVRAAQGTDRARPVIQRFDPERGSFSAIPPLLPPDFEYGNEFTFAEEPGIVWFSSSGGLHRMDLVRREHRLYSRADFNVPVFINGMERDERGRLWFGTWSGTFGQFDPATGTLTNYYAEDGLSLARCVSSRRTDSGEIFFAGFGGYVRFHPEELVQNRIAPEVKITGVRAAGTLLQPAEGEIRLAHDQNTLAFDYVGLHYSDPRRNQYRYLLEGFDAGWNHVGTQRSALYPRLPPGRYTIRVEAASSDGIWSEGGAQLQFVVLPPWWRTWWAYALYGLIFIGGVFAVDRVQRRRLLAAEREKTREREIAQAREIERAYNELKRTQDQLIQQEKLASLGALTAGIAHEIKNPLNFVNNFSDVTGELLLEVRAELDGLDPQAGPEKVGAVREILDVIETNISKISEHGKRADGIVRSMLDHSRGTKGERQPTNLNGLVEEYVGLAYHGMRAQKADFNVTISRDYADGVGKVEVVPQDIGRVLLNLLNNAFQAVHEKATRPSDGAAGGDGSAQYEPIVTVSTRRAGDRIEIRIEDNGSGIPEHLRERIFEPFFTTKPVGSGTGLGLSLSHEIVVNGHGGELTAESRDGEGAAFVVALPEKPAVHAHPSAARADQHRQQITK